jgi:phosphoglucosamine mutase
MARLFGTDGIRGLANAEPLTTELAFRLGRQLVATLLEHHGEKRTRLVVGRDTRVSGPMLEGALVSGALLGGRRRTRSACLPTPGIAFLTRALAAHGGVVLSASHNPYQDNGIKFFSGEGAKFPDAWEEEIEGRLNGPDTAPWPTGVDIGRLVVHEAAEADYIAHARATCPHDLRDMRIVLDCAHGATYRVAPEIFRRLGADAG